MASFTCLPKLFLGLSSICVFKFLKLKYVLVMKLKKKKRAGEGAVAVAAGQVLLGGSGNKERGEMVVGRDAKKQN